ncbi:MAG: hypothetical protein HQL25_06245 [Candidatus Omnitrophica bacterium]|nr:hypothetical protein [Candidatus Omnitrophota bacterium]
MNISLILKNSFDQYKNFYQRLLPWGFFLAVAAAIANSFVLKLANDQVQIILLSLIIGTLFTSWPQMVLYKLSLQIESKGEADEDFNNEIAPRWGRYLTVMYAYQFLILAGLCLFIIPGFLLLTLFWFAPILLLDLNKDELIFENFFKQSQQLVKGNFWQVFSIMIYTAVFVSAPVLIISWANIKYAEIISSVWMALAAPYVYIAQIQTYVALKNMKKDELIKGEDNVG